MRLLLIPVLMASLAFACDNPYEEIGGIKLGCPVDSSQMKKQAIDGSIVFDEWYKINNAGPFTFAEAEAYKGNVEALSFVKTYAMSIKSLPVLKGEITSNLKFLIESLSERWGEFDTTELDKFMRTADLNITYFGDQDITIPLKNSRSEALGMMFVTFNSIPPEDYLLSTWTASISVVYIGREGTKKMELERANTFSGF